MADTLTEYQVFIKTPAGVRKAIVTDFLELEYAKERRAVGLLRFALSGVHAAIAFIEDKAQVEVWRRNQALGLDWYCDFYGLVRDIEWEGVNPGIMRVTCDEQNVMLSWRVVAWAAGVASRTKFTSAKGETIMKTLVDYNLGANATTGNGRKRTGTITGVSVETDGAGGNTLDWYCAPKAGRTVLSELQDLAKVAGGDFEWAKTGAATWQFKWHAGQLGTDKSASVKFGLAYDNMANPRARIERSAEKTAAVVAGQGEGTLRTFVTRTGANYDATNNNIEVFVDARDVESTAGLNAKGDEVLEDAVALEGFDFEVLQTEATAYGSDYKLGDLVTVVSPFTGTALTRCVQAVSVKVLEEGGEAIEVEMVEQ